MKLIAKDAAIAGIQVVPDEVKPLVGYYIPVLVRAVAERYKFSKAPTPDEVRTTGAKFFDGRYVDGTREINISQLGVFNDAMAATTTDTSDSEIVVRDLFTWLQQTFKFRPPVTTPNRFYQSDLIVEFDNNPEDSFRSFAPFVEFLQGLTGKNHQFNRLSFGVDPLSALAPEFIVERRAGMPWTSNRYFSKAHIPTDAHIEALEKLDKLFKKKKN